MAKSVDVPILKDYWNIVDRIAVLQRVQLYQNRRNRGHQDRKNPARTVFHG
jgi:hypothetical protein